MNWEEVRREYETTTVTLAALAEKYDIKIGTIKSRKSREGWSRDATRKDATKTQKVATIRSRDATAKKIENHKQEPIVISDELTDKQRLFVLEYLRDFNATRAAMAVGYSKKTAYSIGWELLRKPEIQAEIQRQKELMTVELGLGVKRVIAEYMKIAFTDITDLLDFGQKEELLYDEEGDPLIDPETGEQMTYSRNFVSFKNSDEVDGTVVGEVKQGKDGVSIKLYDKMRALEKLEKYVGYMTEEDKLRYEKLTVEIDNLKGGGKNPESENWAQALLEVAERRKAVNANVE